MDLATQLQPVHDNKHSDPDNLINTVPVLPYTPDYHTEAKRSTEVFSAGAALGKGFFTVLQRVPKQ